MKGIGGLLLFVAVCEAITIPESVKQEIQANKDDVDAIINYVLHGEGRHDVYNKLAIFSDDTGPRLAGSTDLENAINWTIAEMQSQGFDNVQGESFEMPKWVRGDAHGAILKPRPLKLDILALGTSVPTPLEGITAEVIVVNNFEELEQMAADVPGKIVVYNQEWVNYLQSKDYRNDGATRAAKHGAVAALVRSVTSHSIYSLHTGVQTYGENVTQIPVACVTVEDAEMMQRFQDRGIVVEVFMNMSCQNVGTSMTRNTIAEYTGNTYPNEVVILGGHMDSWDVGYGPMDDAGGVIMSWQVLLILKALGLVPKRTIRTVFWSAEEIGIFGGAAYFEAHKADNASVSLVMESDSGIFKPYGVGFTGHDMARAIMEEIGQLLSPINATGVGPDGSQADIGDWISIGVPGANMWSQNQDYFDFHHSYGDSMTMHNADDHDLATIVWTVMTYVVADLEDKLPRSDDDYYIDSGSLAGVNLSVVTLLSLVTLLFCHF